MNIKETMQLLQIEDVTTARQKKNGTITWKLPIKNNWPGNQANASYIEVASFKSGYVRNNNSGYTNYQLNKRYFEDEYYPEREIDENYNYGKLTGKYTKFQTKKCKLIPIEIDRLEYLISYCLKNYYIKHANFVADGDYVPKWRYDNLADAAKLDYEKRDSDKVQTLEENLDDAVCTIVKHETYYVKLEDKVRDLEEKLENMTEARDCYKDKYKKLDEFYEASKCFDDSMYEGRDDRVKELENKLQSIIRTARH